MITATLMENYIPVWQIRSKSADNAVMNGCQERNNISQVVIYEKAGDLAMKLPALILPKISEGVAELIFSKFNMPYKAPIALTNVKMSEF